MSTFLVLSLLCDCWVEEVLHDAGHRSVQRRELRGARHRHTRLRSDRFQCGGWVVIVMSQGNAMGKRKSGLVVRIVLLYFRQALLP